MASEVQKLILSADETQFHMFLSDLNLIIAWTPTYHKLAHDDVNF